MFHVYRVSVEDSAKFLRTSVPFATRERAEEFAARMRDTYPAHWPVTITERDENVAPHQ